MKKNTDTQKTYREWQKAVDKLFPLKKAPIPTTEGYDAFLGKLRELELGKDPFADKRRSKVDSDMLQDMTSLHTQIRFRDDTDQILSFLYENGTLRKPPSDRMFTVADFDVDQEGKVFLKPNSVKKDYSTLQFGELVSMALSILDKKDQQ